MSDPDVVVPSPAPAVVSDVLFPDAPVLSTKERLKAIRVKTETVDVSDTDVPLLLKITGLSSYDAMEISSGDDGVERSLLESNAMMMRQMVTDPDTGEHLYADWTDEEIGAQPMATSNTIMTAVNMVLGRTSEPGKDLPSTTEGGSSS